VEKAGGCTEPFCSLLQVAEAVEKHLLPMMRKSRQLFGMAKL
jgi:hypothetical protein